MISEFKIRGAYASDVLNLYAEDGISKYPDKWIKLQVNYGKWIEVKCSELMRALDVINK